MAQKIVVGDNVEKLIKIRSVVSKLQKETKKRVLEGLLTFTYCERSERALTIF